jgi:hypothetical protein
MELFASKHFYYIAASYGWGISCLAVLLVMIIRQRIRLRALLRAIEEHK